MKFSESELNKLLNKEVVFQKGMLEVESEIDPGMIGTIINIVPKHDDMILLTFDMGAQIDHNRTKMQANYYDKNHVPCMTAEDVGLWPKDHKIDVYFMRSDRIEKYFSVDPKAYGKFGADYVENRRNGETYTAYLERRLSAILGSDADPI
jgi:hypothetical protein